MCLKHGDVAMPGQNFPLKANYIKAAEIMGREINKS